MFVAAELTSVESARQSGPTFEPIAGRGMPEPPPSFVTDGFFSAYAEDILSPRPPGPGDSNYELAFSVQDLNGDAGPDWDAEASEIEPEAPSTEEIRALSPSAWPGPESWHHRFIASWGQGLIVTALALIGIAMPAIAYLLWQTLHLGQAPALLSPTLIAGFACAVALLMIAVPLLLLAASLTELVRDLRRLSEQSGDRPFAGRR
jgi:hypothetical protein